MIRVIIADDEEYERDYLERTLSKEYEGVLEVVYAAADGADALEKAKELKPDICLFDIRMPRLDGLEVTAQLAEAFPDIQVVIVSAYDDFSYAREAMKLGVKDFLVKPYLDKELIQTMDKIIATIGGFRKKAPSDRIVDTVTGDIDRDIVWKLALTQSEESDITKELSLWGIETASYKCIVFYYDGLKTIGEKGCDIVKGIFRINGTRTLVSRLFDLMVVYVFSEDEDSFIELNQCINKTRNYMKESGDRVVFCGVSGIYESKDTAKGFEEASGFIGSYADRTVQNGLNEVISRIRDILTYMDRSGFAFAGRNREQALLWLLKIRESLMADYSGKDLSDCYLQQLMVILRGLNRKLGIRVTNEDIYWLTGLFEADGHDLTDITERIVDELIERSPDIQVNHNAVVVRRAKEFIKDHYNEHINLQIVADAINISPGHLSKSFKSTEKNGFSEYLTNVRLEKAKELLKRGDKSIQEIAYEVGFSDANYFGKCFKKNEGITPKEYCSMLILDKGRALSE
ncbi:MAG: response regulator [Lachnospiraceae bacterium]|nr:response regulator [Lachnospiraceae bacterium]